MAGTLTDLDPYFETIDGTVKGNTTTLLVAFNGSNLASVDIGLSSGTSPVFTVNRGMLNIASGMAANSYSLNFTFPMDPSEGTVKLTIDFNKLTYTLRGSPSSITGPVRTQIIVINYNNMPLDNDPEPSKNIKVPNPMDGSTTPVDPLEPNRDTSPGLPPVTYSPAIAINTTEPSRPEVQEYLTVDIKVKENLEDKTELERIEDTDNKIVEFTWERTRFAQGADPDAEATRLNNEAARNRFILDDIQASISLKPSVSIDFIDILDIIRQEEIEIQFQFKNNQGNATFIRSFGINDIILDYEISLGSSIARTLVNSDLTLPSATDSNPIYTLNTPIPFNSTGYVRIRIKAHSTIPPLPNEIRSKPIYFDRTGGATNVPEPQIIKENEGEIERGSSTTLKIRWPERMEGFTGGVANWFDDLDPLREGSFIYGGYLRDGINTIFRTETLPDRGNLDDIIINNKGSIHRYNGSTWVNKGTLFDIEDISQIASISKGAVLPDSNRKENDIFIFEESLISDDEAEDSFQKGQIFQWEGEEWLDRGNLSILTAYSEYTITITFPFKVFNNNNSPSKIPFSKGRVDYIIPRNSIITRETEVAGPYIDRIISIKYDNTSYDELFNLENPDKKAIFRRSNSPLNPLIGSIQGSSWATNQEDRTMDTFTPPTDWNTEIPSGTGRLYVAIVTLEEEKSPPTSSVLLYSDIYALEESNLVNTSITISDLAEMDADMGSASRHQDVRTATLSNIPNNVLGNIHITVTRNAAETDDEEIRNRVQGPSSSETKIIPIDTTADPTLVSDICTYTREIQALDWISESKARAIIGGAFIGVSDLIYVDPWLYGTVQIALREEGSNTDYLGSSIGTAGILFRVHKNCDTYSKPWQIVKGYTYYEEAARSLINYTNNSKRGYRNEIVFFEGSHYDNYRNRNGTKGYLQKIVQPSHLTLEPETITDTFHIQKQQLGLNWRSRLPIDKENRYGGIHGLTASPLVTDKLQTPNIYMITGYGNLDSVTFDSSIEEIENWPLLRYGTRLEPRIPYLQTNERKGFDVATELATLTNSIIGFGPTGDFFFRPRGPYTAVLKRDLDMDSELDISYFRSLNKQWPNKEGFLLIDKEIIHYIPTIIDSDNKTIVQGTSTTGSSRIKPVIGFERGVQETEKAEHKAGTDIIFLDYVVELNLANKIEKPINDLNLRSDYSQLFNQIKITYGEQQDLEYYIEDSAEYRKDLSWARDNPEYQYSVEENGGKLMELSVPLTQHDKEWVKYIALDYLQRFKDVHYLIDLELKPSFYFELGEIILLRQEERAHLFNPCQIYRINQNFEGQTTSVSLRTIPIEYSKECIPEYTNIKDDVIGSETDDITITTDNFIERKVDSRIKEVYNRSYQMQQVLWKVSIQNNLTEEWIDISTPETGSLSGMEQNLDYPELTVFTISELSLTINDPEGIFSPLNTSKDNFFKKLGYKSPKGYKARIRIEAGFEPDTTLILFQGQIIESEHKVKPGTFNITISDNSQEFRTKDITNFGLKKEIILEEESNETEGITGTYLIPNAISPPSQDSVTLLAPESTTNANIIELNNVQELATEGDLNPKNYKINDTNIQTEGSLLPQNPIMRFKAPYRHKKIDIILKDLLEHYNLYNPDLDPTPDINFSYIELKPHFSTLGRPGYEIEHTQIVEIITIYQKSENIPNMPSEGSWDGIRFTSPDNWYKTEKEAKESIDEGKIYRAKVALRNPLIYSPVEEKKQTSVLYAISTTDLTLSAQKNTLNSIRFNEDSASFVDSNNLWTEDVPVKTLHDTLFKVEATHEQFPTFSEIVEDPEKTYDPTEPAIYYQRISENTDSTEIATKTDNREQIPADHPDNPLHLYANFQGGTPFRISLATESWSFTGFPTDFIYDEGDENRKEAFYLLYCSKAISTRPRIVKYDIEEDKYVTLYQHESFATWWNIVANEDFTRFYILGSTGGGPLEHVGDYDSVVPTLRTKYASLIKIWEYNVENGAFKVLIEDFFDASPVGDRSSFYNVSSSTPIPQLAQHYNFSGDSLASRLADTRKGMTLIGNDLYYIYGNSRNDYGLAKKNVTTTSTASKIVSLNEGLHTGFDYTINNNEVLYVYTKIDKSNNTSSIIKGKANR